MGIFHFVTFTMFAYIDVYKGIVSTTEYCGRDVNIDNRLVGSSAASIEYRPLMCSFRKGLDCCEVNGPASASLSH